MRPSQRLRAGLELLGYASLLAGLPVVLLRFGGIPSASELRVALSLHWVSAHLALQLAGLVGWVIYAYLVGWASVEIASALRHGPSRGPRLLQPLTARIAALVLISAGRVVLPATASAAGAVPVPAIAVAAAASAASAPSAESTTPVPLARHTVVLGDCLWDLALDYYGDGTRWTLIWEANRETVPDPTEIDPGQVLTIPAAAKVTSGRYSVEPGDSLWSIASDRLGSGADWQELWKANVGRGEPAGAVFEDPNLIRPGWSLEVPRPPSTPTTPESGTTPATPAPTPLSPPAPPLPAAGPGPTSTAGPDPQPAHRSSPASDVHGADMTEVAESAAALPVGAAAMWWGVRRRRRARRAALNRDRVPTPLPEEARAAEHAAYSAGGAAADRADAALRHLRVVLGRRHDGEEQPIVSAVLARPDGSVEVVIHGADRVPAGWREAGEGRWALPADVDVALPPAELRAPAPCPSLVSLGTTADGATVLLHLEAVGGVTLSGGDDDSRRELARRWAAELALAPYAACVRVVCADLGDLPVGPDRILHAERTSDLPAMAASAAEWGRDARSGAGMPLPAARLLGTVGDPFFVVFDPQCEAQVEAADGLAVVGGTVGLVVDVDNASAEVPGVGLVRLGEADPAQVDAVVEAERCAATDEGVVPGSPEADEYEPTLGAVLASVERQPLETMSDRVTIEILGDTRVAGIGLAPRSQLLAAATALAVHRDGMSRSKFVEIMWRNEVTGPTVANRLRELRNWLGTKDSVVDNGDWIRLGNGVACDWWEFERLARSPLTRIRALGLVRGMPLGGVLHEWRERDALVEAIEARIIGTAVAAAEEALAAQRPDDALMATECALRLNEFDQRAVQARMRAFAQLGDAGGVEGAYAAAEAAFTDEEEAVDAETTEVFAQVMKQLEARRRRRR